MVPDELIAAGHALDVRDGEPGRDAIDGAVPAIVIEPHTPEAVAASLSWASERRLSVLIEGGGTKRGWGRRPDRLDAVLSTRKLNRLIAHCHGDLTVTVEAGLTLGQLNLALAAHGQHLPLDPPFAPHATVGGLLASNDSGPARHRFGTPRDLVIGIQLATTDGRLARAGGQVVKNVAGYDLSKLVCGSFGTLATIVSATFKLAPLPASSSTLLIEAGTVDALAGVVRVISESQLEPLAFECHIRRLRSGSDGWTRGLLRFGSVRAAVDAQVDAASRHVTPSGATSHAVSGEAESRLWQAYAGAMEETGGATVRLSWLPADLGRVSTMIEQLAATVDLELTGRAGVGAGLLRLAGDTSHLAASIERLGQSEAVGNVVLTRGSTELKALVDVWGPRRNQQLLESIKRAVDPSGTLGAGRF